MADQTPDTLDFEIVRGDTYDFDVLVEEDNTPVDFSTHTGERMQIRADSHEGRLLAEYSTSDGTLTTTAGGRVQASFEASDTEEWPETVAYDFESEDSNGDVRTYAEGEITVEPDVTR